MDNNNSQQPRKRITPEVARKRQLTALFVIAFVILILIILIAKGCTKGGSGSKNKNDTKPKTTTVTTTAPQSTEPVITTTAPQPTTVPGPGTSGFKLDRYSVFLNVGGTEMPRVQEYPDGTVEADERWSSSDESIATVDWQGNITAVAPGECYVTLKSAVNEEQEVNIKVTVADSGTSGGTSASTTTSAVTDQADQSVY